MKILSILMPCSIQLTSLTTWEGAPLAEQHKVNTTSFGLNTITYQAAKIWNYLPSHYKEASFFFSILSNIYWNGLFYKCFYRLPVNCNGIFPTSNVCFNVSFKFHLYHTHRSFFIQSPNSPRLMLFVCNVCDSKLTMPYLILFVS